MYMSYEEWSYENVPKSIWFVPLLFAFFMPQAYQRASLSPISDFLWERALVTVVAFFIAYYVNKKYISQVFGDYQT